MINAPIRTTRITVVLIAALAAACTSSASGSPAASAADGAGGTGSSSQPAAGNGGSATSTAACSLLTTAEIQQALGAPMKDGVLQTGNPDQASCEWDGQDDDTLSIGVIVQPYDDTIWQAMASSSQASPVSGIGEAAYKGWPHAGDLSVKQAGHEIDVGIVDFKDNQPKVDAAALTLAKLVLSRI
jgi:hypothetical protein